MNLLGCHGKGFKAVIADTPTFGVISVHQHRVHLCQNHRNGSVIKGEKFGYKYSWYVGTGDLRAIEVYNVKDFELYELFNEDSAKMVRVTHAQIAEMLGIDLTRLLIVE